MAGLTSTAAPPRRSGLYVGSVRHRRRRPTRNEFRTRTYHVLLDLDELAELDREVVGFGHNRPALASLHDEDHLGPTRRDLRHELAAWLAAHGRRLPEGRVQVLTGLRVLGLGFDPVSWWFCHHADGRLALVVAEVHNTFGDRYAYLLDELEERGDGTVRARADKAFHVSPFLAIEGHVYDFVLRPPDERGMLVHMEVSDGDGVVFDATQSGRRDALTSRTLLRALVAHPHLPVRTLALIHAQALRLWWRRVPFHRRPGPPREPGATMTAPAPTAAQDRARHAIAQMLAQLEVGALEVTLPDGRRRCFGHPGSELRARIRVHDWRFFTRLLHGASVGVGESYMHREWDSDDLVSLFRIVIANRAALRRITPAALLNIAADKLAHAARANRQGQTKRNVAAHYDLSNELYALFLDETMTYSAAIFERPQATLEEAQRAKYARLAERLRLHRGAHVLEIGCGWGGFAVYAARTHGCRVTGITLSREQAELARQRVAAAGVDDLVDIQIVDYREVTGTYDRIVSIEMLEAVGHRYLGDYFAAIDRLLAPDGLAAIQVITIPEQRYEHYRRRPDFIQHYIFPGGHLPSLHAMTGAMGRHSELFVEEAVNIAPHYAETLRRWRERFLANIDDVRALGFDEPFVRMWEFYLAYCEAAFLARYVNDLQLLLTRPMNGTLGTRPYGRALVPVREADLPRRGVVA